MFRVGDKVQVTQGRRWAGITWTIIKINPRTYKLRNEANGQVLNADHTLCVSVEHTDNSVIVRTAPINERTLPHAVLGSFLQVKTPNVRGLNVGDVVVVLKDSYDKVKVTKAGGFNDRYWNLPHRCLDTVDAKVVAV